MGLFLGILSICFVDWLARVMDKLALVLNKAIENIAVLSADVSKLKSANTQLVSRCAVADAKINELEGRIAMMESNVNPDVFLDVIKLEELMIKICRENPNNLGPKGPAGDTGPMGRTGPIGATGCIGANGMTGATGATGAQGCQGLSGPQGVQGEPGIQIGRAHV